MSRIRISIALLIITCVSILAAPPAGLQQKIDARVKSDKALRGAHIGVFIQSLADGDVWYMSKADEQFVPASTTKVITGIVALEYLKPEFRYQTRLVTDGQITDGILNGNLYVQCNGDPSLTVDDLRTFADLLAAGDPDRGIPSIKEINGQLCLDESFFPQPGPLLGTGWEAEDLPWYYAAPAGALSVNRNAVTVRVVGGAVGQPPIVTVTPSTGLFTIENTAVTRERIRANTVKVLPQGNRVRITGVMVPGAEVVEKLSVPDPVQFMGEQFRQALQAEGIIVGEAVAGTAPKELSLVLLEHESLPLRDLLACMLKESDNFSAEQLRWTLLALYSLEKPLDQRFQAMLQDFGVYSDVLTHGISLVDGSGLSRLDQVTPEAMVRMLAFAAASPNFDYFYQGLPIAGVDGTLKTRYRNNPACGNAHAKTGTMTGVSTLAGYVTTPAGERLTFAIFLDGYKRPAAAARKLQDDIVGMLAAPCNN